jgi:hypothetical protein
LGSLWLINEYVYFDYFKYAFQIKQYALKIATLKLSSSLPYSIHFKTNYAVFAITALLAISALLAVTALLTITALLAVTALLTITALLAIIALLAITALSTQKHLFQN